MVLPLQEALIWMLLLTFKLISFFIFLFLFVIWLFRTYFFFYLQYKIVFCISFCLILKYKWFSVFKFDWIVDSLVACRGELT